VAEVNRLVKQANGDIIGLGNDSSDETSDEEDGEEDTTTQEPEPINQSDDYIDEDKYTTVSIESVGISRAGFSRAGSHDSLDAEAAAKAAAADAEKLAAEVAKHKKGEVQRDANGKRIWTKERPRTEWPKKKKKKVRYENKADRKVARFKEGAKKRKMKEKRDKKDE
jgi:ribosomal RNA-processing protein 17